MKTFPALCLATTLALIALHAQTPTPAEPVAPVPAAAEAGTLITKEYVIRPGLIARKPLEEGQARAIGGRMDAKDFLLACGVTFPEGSTVTYIVSKNRLIVRNTQANLDLVQTLVGTGNPGDPFVKDAGLTPAGEEQGAWRNVVLVLEVYALPKDDALAILEGERGSAARYQRAVDLAKTKKARLEILTALTGKSGIKSMTESLDEVRYATEFAPGSMKGAVPAAMAFETRNVGDTIEFEPVIGPDGHTCEVSLVPQRVSLAGFRELAGAPGDPTVAQPLFVMQKLITSTTLEAGAPHYLGTLSRPSESGVADGAAAEIWLAFLRVNLHGPAPGEVKPPAKPFNMEALNLEYSVYSMDRAQAREILVSMPALEAPWEKLQGLLQEKRARFEHCTAIKCKSGQKAVAEESHEVRYATGYAPPGHTRTIETTRRATVTPPEFPNRGLTAKTSAVETTTVERDTPNADGTPGAPLSIESRNAGVSVEVEPVIGPDGITIELNNVVKSVAHLGHLKTGRAPAFLDQPLFEERTITTSQTITIGRHLLVSTFNPPGADGVNDRADDGRTWLLFVRALPNEP